MCGLAGLVSLTDAPADRAAVAAMVRRLKHRGPDAETVHVDGPVGLGHARLSIIDLPGGGQPLFNEDRSVVVICNGEIYNYRELRRQLQQRGHQFTTDSDCEVLVHLWEESSREMTETLRGMYACVVYDRRQGVVFAARDPFGQKPLFYHLGTETLAFASEMKAFRALPEVPRELDLSAVDEFLRSSFVASPRTMFQAVQRLPAGGWFEIRQQGSRFAASTFTTGVSATPRRTVDRNLSCEDHLARVAAGVDDAVRSHLVADVPVGVFLSGGIDSSLITAIAARHVSEPLRTFAITFPGSRHDEGPKARRVAAACGTRHQEFPFSAHDLPAALLAAARQLDQPLADTAVLPLLHLARETAREVKVVLTGDGGDELFAGYRKYRRLVGFPGRARWLHHAVSSLCPPHHLSACAPDPTGSRRLRSRMLELLAPVSRSAYHRQGWEGWERHELYQDELATAVREQRSPVIESTMTVDRNESLLNSALRLDQGPVLADRLLHKTDAATMAFGLEARAPLLDPQLAAIAAALPEELQVTAKITKVALRRIAEQYLPDEIVAAPKKGFSMPLDSWLRVELRDFTRSCLLDDSVTVPRFFQRSQVERLLTVHAAGKNHAQRIYSLLVFELWCREAL